MHKAIVLVVQMLLGAYGERSFITLGDKDFMGEDPKILAELARRKAFDQPLRKPPENYIGGRLHNFTRRQFEAEPGSSGDHDGRTLQNVTGQHNEPKQPQRRLPEWHNSKQYEGEATEDNLRIAQMKVMEQAMYKSQDRLKELDWIYKKYEKDARFRIAFAFKKLDEWRLEMHGMYQYLIRKEFIDPRVFTVAEHIMYYTNFARKNIDITYTIDFLMQLQEEMKETMKKDRQAFQRGAAGMPGDMPEGMRPGGPPGGRP